MSTNIERAAAALRAAGKVMGYSEVLQILAGEGLLVTDEQQILQKLRKRLELAKDTQRTAWLSATPGPERDRLGGAGEYE